MPRPTFKKIYAALPEQLVANINNYPFWVNFDKHLIVTFLGIADDCLSSLVLNKCDEKTQRQLAETWSYGWILHGIISGRTRLRKHHKVLYNRGNELQKFGVVWETFFNEFSFLRRIQYLYTSSSVLHKYRTLIGDDSITIFDCKQPRIRLNPAFFSSFERPVVLPR